MPLTPADIKRIQERNAAQPQAEPQAGAPAVVLQPQVPKMDFSPTFETYSGLWDATQNTIERLSKARLQGYDTIGLSLKGYGVLRGLVSYETVLQDQQKQLKQQELQKNEDQSKKYLPLTVEAMAPIAEAIPYVETTMAELFTGGAIGGAAGSVIPGVGNAAGAVVGSQGMVWATNAAIDTGDIYLKLREAGADHQLASNIARPAGALTGATGMLDANILTGAARVAFQKEFVKHLAKGTVNPGFMRYLTSVGVGTATAGVTAGIKEMSKEMAAVFDKDVKRPEDVGKAVVEAMKSGLLTTATMVPIFGAAGKSAAHMAKAMRALRQVIDAQTAKPSATGTSVAPVPSPPQAQDVGFPRAQEVPSAKQQLIDAAKKDVEEKLAKWLELKGMSDKQTQVVLDLQAAHNENVFDKSAKKAMVDANKVGLRIEDNMKKASREYAAAIDYLEKVTETAEFPAQGPPKKPATQVRPTVNKEAETIRVKPTIAAAERQRIGREKLQQEVVDAEAEAAKLAGFVDVDVFRKARAEIEIPRQFPQFSSRQQLESWLQDLVATHGREEAEAIVRDLVDKLKATKPETAQIEAWLKETRKGLPVGGVAPTTKRAKAEKRLRLANANLKLFDAEQRLNDPEVTGSARRKAVSDLADGLVDMANTGMAGDTALQLEDATKRLQRIDNPLTKIVRNLGVSLHPYYLKWRLLFQKSQDADKLAENYDLGPARKTFNDLRDLFKGMLVDSMTEAYGKNSLKTMQRLLATKSNSVKFRHKELANQDHKGRQRPGRVETVKMTEDELLKLWLQFNDPDLRKGLETGNGYSFDPLDGMSMYSQVKAHIEASEDLKRFAKGYLDFYRKRKPLVEEYYRQRYGQSVDLGDHYSGYARREGYADLDLDPTAGGQHHADWWSRTFNRTIRAGTLKSRKPESKLPVHRSSAYDDAWSTNSSIAKTMAFSDIADAHGQVLKNSDFLRFVEHTFGEKDAFNWKSNVDWINQHLRDTAQRIPDAESVWAKVAMEFLRASYPIKLGLDVFQYAKQLTGALAAIPHVGTRRFIRAQIDYHHRSAFVDALMNRDKDLQRRWGVQFRSTVTGVEMPDLDAHTIGGATQRAMGYPMEKGDQAASPLVWWPAYVRVREEGGGHYEAVTFADRIVEATQSTFRIEMLPQMARDMNLKFVSAFLTQPMLMASTLTTKLQTVLNHPTQVAAWKDLGVSALAIKTSALAYLSIGAGVRYLLQPTSEKVQEEIFNLAASFVTEPAIPIVSDLIHNTLVSGAMLAWNGKTHMWEYNELPADVANNTAKLFVDTLRFVSDPDTTVTHWTLLKDFVGSVFNLKLKIPQKPVEAIDKIFESKGKKKSSTGGVRL